MKPEERDEAVREIVVLPCPWCGSAGEDLLVHHDTGQMQMQCVCGAAGPMAETFAACYSAWNTVSRPQVPGG